LVAPSDPGQQHGYDMNHDANDLAAVVEHLNLHDAVHIGTSPARRVAHCISATAKAGSSGALLIKRGCAVVHP